MNLRRALLSHGFVLTAIAACSVDNETQLTVAIETETQIPTELDTFTVTVKNLKTGDVRLKQDYVPKDGREFPSTLALIPFDEDSIGSSIQVDVEGKLGNTVVLSRTSVATYIEGRNLLLKMPLRMACFQFKGCAVGQTCVGGQCVAPQVPAETLVDYQENFVSPRASNCFDEAQCLTQKMLVKIEEDCTFPIATPDAVNVAIRWAAAPARLLALESGDDREGWTRISADRGRLSQGACDSHFQRKDANGVLLVSDWAKQVYVTTGCAAKTSLVPYCLSTATNQAGIGAVNPE